MLNKISNDERILVGLDDDWLTGYLLVARDGKTWDEGNRQVWSWKLLDQDVMRVDSGNDLKTPAFPDETSPADNEREVLKAASTLISFMLACVEDDNETGDNFGLFDAPAREWISYWSEELTTVQMELNEITGEGN